MRENCSKCGRDHAALNIEFQGRRLIRHTRGSSHRLRIAGGAFGFAVDVIEKHAGDFSEVLIIDDATGELFQCDRAVVDRAERRTFSEQYGPQVILRIDHLERTRTRPVRYVPAPEPITAPTSTEDCSAQPALF